MFLGNLRHLKLQTQLIIKNLKMKILRFYNLLVEANEPLYEGASDSKLSIFMRLLACKSNWNVSNQCLEFISKMLLDVTFIKDRLPKKIYDAKRLVSKLGLETKRIDCCVNG